MRQHRGTREPNDEGGVALSIMEARLPATVTTSLLLHAAVLVGYIQLTKAGPKAAGRVIGDVDLLIKVRASAAAARPVQKASPPSLMNFLKLALPAMPKVAAPLEVKPVETLKKSLIDVPDKLDDKGRLKRLAALEPLDLGKTRTAAPKLDAGKLDSARRAVPEALPKLEEVGARRAPPKVLAMAAALEEESRERLKPQGLDALSKLPDPVKRAAPQAAPLLPEEAAPAQRKSALGRMADMLTSEARPLPMQAEAPPKVERPRPRLDALKQSLPRQEHSAIVEKKKAMEIEGPLSDRRLVYYELPPFPAWLSAQGVAEAETRIKLYVSPTGEVLEDIRVETTSGYGRLDRLAMDFLKRWKFEASPGAGRQWGIITFRFVSE